MAGKRAFDVVFSEKALSEIADLKEMLDVTDRSEVLFHALRWTYWCAKQTAAGKKILVKDSTGKVDEVVFPNSK